MKTIFTLAALMTLAGSLAFSAENEGTLQVTVVDEDGALVENAPIYIYGVQKTKFVGGREIPGSTTLTMPAGTYRVSSALARRTGEYLDRYASHEAYVRVAEGDNASILLTLRPIDDPMSSVTVSDLRKIGLAPVLVQNLR